MVKMPQSDPVLRLGYHSELGALPAETFSLDALARRIPSLGSPRAEQIGFHLIIICVGGTGRHIADFAEVPMRPGRILHIRPGQVHRWVDVGSFAARLVLAPRFRPGPGRADDWFPGDRSLIADAAGELDVIERTVDELAFEQDRYDGADAAGAAMTAIVDLLAIRIGRLATNAIDRSALPDAYVEFRNSIEASLGRRRSVTDHARRLGYSVDTLDRACLRVVGQRAKRVLDDRVALEAQRLLAHSDDTAAAIGRRLGFDEATNFTKFMKRMSGRTPAELRSGLATGS